MKKLISIGVALALLAMVVLPGSVAAYTPPPTYSKVPFAIIQSGFELVGDILTAAGSALGLPTWLNESLMNTIGGWAGGPLSWTVDMLAWGVGLMGQILDALSSVITLPFPVSDLLNSIACGLLTCWSATNCTGNFTPCAGNATP